MNDIEAIRILYDNLGRFSISLLEKILRSEKIENYNISRFGGSVRYVVPPDGRTLFSVVDNYQPSIASSVIEDRLEYCYITYDECLYGSNRYKHQENIGEDFFSLSTVYDLNVLKVMYIGSYLYHRICSTNIEQMVLVDIDMIESYYQYLIKEYGSAY